MAATSPRRATTRACPVRTRRSSCTQADARHVEAGVAELDVLHRLNVRMPTFASRFGWTGSPKSQRKRGWAPRNGGSLKSNPALSDLAVCVGSCSCRWSLSACWRPGARTRTPRRTTRWALRRSTPNSIWCRTTRSRRASSRRNSAPTWATPLRSIDGTRPVSPSIDLAAVCTQIWRADPTALATIHSDWIATQAMIADEAP